MHCIQGSHFFKSYCAGYWFVYAGMHFSTLKLYFSPLPNAAYILQNNKCLAALKINLIER